MDVPQLKVPAWLQWLQWWRRRGPDPQTCKTDPRAWGPVGGSRGGGRGCRTVLPQQHRPARHYAAATSALRCGAAAGGGGS
ncbi:hypothetical protein HaLaN_18511, partial [Haematococcus lacustris]